MARKVYSKAEIADRNGISTRTLSRWIHTMCDMQILYRRGFRENQNYVTPAAYEYLREQLGLE